MSSRQELLIAQEELDGFCEVVYLGGRAYRKADFCDLIQTARVAQFFFTETQAAHILDTFYNYRKEPTSRS